MKTPILLDAVLEKETMQMLQSNLEEKGNPSILKYDFSSKTYPSIYTSVTPQLFDWLNKTKIQRFVFSQH